jgi:acetyl-CoA synthetase
VSSDPTRAPEIEALLLEQRTFPPDPGFAARANATAARPKFLLFTPDLPKTRSGKIMRRLLRDTAEGRTLGDTSTLADAAVVDTIREHSGRAED